MAGGPNASTLMCMHCTGKAGRVSEGLENDWYRCEVCDKEFGIDWSYGQPEAACWPPSAKELEEAQRILALMAKLPRSGSKE